MIPKVIQNWILWPSLKFPQVQFFVRTMVAMNCIFGHLPSKVFELWRCGITRWALLSTSNCRHKKIRKSTPADVSQMHIAKFVSLAYFACVSFLHACYFGTSIYTALRCPTTQNYFITNSQSFLGHLQTDSMMSCIPESCGLDEVLAWRQTLLSNITLTLNFKRKTPLVDLPDLPQIPRLWMLYCA